MIYRVCTDLGWPERAFDFKHASDAISFATTYLEHQAPGENGTIKTQIKVLLIMEDEKCEEDQRTE